MTALALLGMFCVMSAQDLPRVPNCVLDADSDRLMTNPQLEMLHCITIRFVKHLPRWRSK